MLPLKRPASAPHMPPRFFLFAWLVVSVLAPPIYAQRADGGSFLTAELDLRSTPAGATVSIDGRTIGTTPVTVSAIRPGRRRLNVTYRGYVPIDRWVDIPAGETVELTLELEPLRGTVLFESNADSELEAYLNGRWRPVSQLELPPGTHQIRFRAFGYKPARRPVSVDVSDGDAEPEVLQRVRVFLQPVETATVGIADLSEPVRSRDGTLLSPLILDMTTDAPVQIRMSIINAAGTEVYTAVTSLDRRRTRIMWNGEETPGSGSVPAGATAPPGTKNNYTVVIRGTEQELPGTPITRAFEMNSRAERRGDGLWLNGFGTPLFPLPVASTQPRYVAAVGGGSVYKHINSGEWSVPAYLRTGAVLFDAVVLSASGELSVAAEDTEPTGLVAFNLGTVRYALNDVFGVAAYAGITADEITDRSVEASRLHGDLPASVQLGAVRLAAVPGVRIDTGRNFSSVERVIPAAGGAVSADHRALRMTISGETRWYFTPLRYKDVQQRYAVDVAYAPSVSPVAVYTAVILNNFREGYNVRAEVGVALSIP